MEDPNVLSLGLLALHSLLRWLIIFLLLLNIIRSYISGNAQKYTDRDVTWNFRLMLVMYINLAIGLYHYFFGEHGFSFFLLNSFGEVVGSPFMRFWAIEHPFLILVAIGIITYSRKIAKTETVENTESKHMKMGIFYIVVLVIVLLAIPWPFREMFKEYPWFRLIY
jgi:hypothetical protein